MILFDLFWTFFKIGLFSFGGGYAMIPLMQIEIRSRGWLTLPEFADIIAVAEMTPGPIGVNAATFVGVKTAGMVGSVVATMGVAMPSFILVIITAHYIGKFRNNRNVDAVIKGIRPATIGLIASAVMFFAQVSIFKGYLPLREGFLNLTGFLTGRAVEFSQAFSVSPAAILIFVIILIGVRRFRLHPIAAILLSAGLGILLYRY